MYFTKVKNVFILLQNSNKLQTYTLVEALFWAKTPRKYQITTKINFY